MDERDIWRAAQATINAYGDGAEDHAIERFEALRAAGEIEGAATWEHVITKIRDIKRTMAEGKNH